MVLQILTSRDDKYSIPRATWYMKDVKSPEVNMLDFP